MGKIITFFNNKGGVGKTTCAHNVAACLVKKGKNVLLIDADSQMNLTAAVLGLCDDVVYSNDVESSWREATGKYTNIKDYLEWYIDQDTRKETPTITLHEKLSDQLLPDDSRGKLHCLIGNVEMFKLETRMYSIATNTAMQNDSTIFKVQEAIRSLFRYNDITYDFILIDTSPSASSIINGIFVMMSDYFLAPVTPNFFSKQAIDNFTDIMGNWITLLTNFRQTNNKNGLHFSPKFLGIVINMAKRFQQGKEKKVTKYAEEWRKKIDESIDKFYSYLIDSHRTITKNDFNNIFSESQPFVISEICDFTGQIRSVAETAGVPVVNLTQDDVKKACEIIGIQPFYIKLKSKNGDPQDHYQSAFYELTKAYTYIAECLCKLL
jgi:chromosome partitioning protein